jgi:hypothetical protein
MTNARKEWPSASILKRKARKEIIEEVTCGQRHEVGELANCVDIGKELSLKKELHV